MEDDQNGKGKIFSNYKELDIHIKETTMNPSYFARYVTKLLEREPN